MALSSSGGKKLQYGHCHFWNLQSHRGDNTTHQCEITTIISAIKERHMLYESLTGIFKISQKVKESFKEALSQGRSEGVTGLGQGKPCRMKSM